MRRYLLRSVLPSAVFLAVLAAHVTLRGLFPEHVSAQSQWAALPSRPASAWLTQYIENGGYWFGYSYALSLAFAAVALRRYRERRSCCARNLALGGITLTGFLAVVGCFLVGCCGSPMLIVYLNLFGAAFLPLAKPLMAGITTCSIALGWWWMLRAERKAACGPQSKDSCGC